jgi:hypothetical protein
MATPCHMPMVSVVMLNVTNSLIFSPSAGSDAAGDRSVTTILIVFGAVVGGALVAMGVSAIFCRFEPIGVRRGVTKRVEDGRKLPPPVGELSLKRL